MANGSTLIEQLVTLWVQRPAMPEEPERSGIAGNWMHLGTVYAETVRLFRAQLRTAETFGSTELAKLLSMVREAKEASAWDQSILSYLLIDLQDGSSTQRVEAASYLVAAERRTAAQLLAASLVLAGNGLFATAVYGTKRILQDEQVTGQECLEVCALLIGAFKHTAGASKGPVADQKWLLAIEFHHEATKLIRAAVSIDGDDSKRQALVAQLQFMEQLANRLSDEPNGGELHAIQQVVKREGRERSRTISRPVLRTIHHLACTGGTVISKCLAAMPKVVLISEVNPHNRYGNSFEPTNPLLLLERGFHKLSEEDIKEEFLRQMEHVERICNLEDMNLIVRDHSHTDFCMGTSVSPICPVADYLGADHELLSVVTVRHPLDSYLSLMVQKWETQFSPSTLEEYSCRYMKFLDRYQELPLRRYENFCNQPKAFMEELCRLLEICYCPGFAERFGTIQCSGDSGRKVTDAIALPSRRSIPDSVAKEVKSSPTYIALVQRLGYDDERPLAAT